ncbi:MAG: hypothetical protein AAF437_16855 [Pseudomonadota bacterium]
MRMIIWAVAALYFATAVYMFAAPREFYDGTPGVAMMGPYNTHFIRDAGLAFLTSAGALAWGNWKQYRAVAVFGAIWPCLHALFHIWIWLARGLPLDQVAFVNLVGIQAPAWLALIAATRLSGEEA